MLYLSDPDVTLHHGDVLATLRELPAESVDCVVTSPPYWGLRDYGTGAWEGGDADCDHAPPKQSERDFKSGRGQGQNDKYSGASCTSWTHRDGSTYRDTCGKCGATRIDQQLGLEPTPEQYVERMVEVFREVRRVLAPHGTVWLNLGDSYAHSTANHPPNRGLAAGKERQDGVKRNAENWATMNGDVSGGTVRVLDGLKPKDLVGIPWRIAFALQADGWYLRSDIIWAKPNPMPESVTDRPTKAHEYVFLLSKQPRYFFDQEAVREAHHHDGRTVTTVQGQNGSIQHRDGERWPNAGRNIRSVWKIATQPYPEAHFATFPEELARRCIAAGCPEQVCRVCGKARERVVERERPNIEVPMTPREQAQREEAKRLYERKELIGPSNNQKSRGLSEIWTNAKATKIVGESWTECVCEEWGQQALDRPMGAISSDPALAAPATKYRPGIVLDPFMGSGTVAYVARKLGRHAVGIDLNAEYLELAARRLQQQSLFAETA